MSVTGPTKAELAADILALLSDSDLWFYVNHRGKPDNWAPTREDARRALMARTREQLWNALDKLTAPAVCPGKPLCSCGDRV